MKWHVLSHLRIEDKELRSRGGGSVATSASGSHHGSDPSPRNATHQHLLFFAGDGNRKERAKGTRSADAASLSVRKPEAEEVARYAPLISRVGTWEVGFRFSLPTSGSHPAFHSGSWEETRPDFSSYRAFRRSLGHQTLLINIIHRL